jgi:transposase
LSDAEQQGLEKLVKRHTLGQQYALRGRIVLLAAAGTKNTEIAKELKVTLDTVRLWRGRWLDLQSMALADLSVEERLQDLPRPGAPGHLTADQRCQIEALACEAPEEAGRLRTGRPARLQTKSSSAGLLTIFPLAMQRDF